MQLDHILRIGTDGKPKSLLSFNAQSKVQTTTLSQWSDSALKGKPLVMLLPASWLYSTKTTIASKNLDVLKKSIPFAIEEELSNEVADNFYAFKLNSDNSQDVIAVAKELLTGVGQAIKDNKLKVSAIYSELDWLPQSTKAISVWFEDNHALIRFADGQAMRATHQQLPQLIDLFKADLQTLHTNNASALSGTTLQIHEDLNEASCKDHLLRQQLMDLYLDEIKAEKQQQKTESWKLVGGLAAALLVSWFGIQWYQMMQLDNAIEDFKNQQQALFKQAFPDAAPAELVDPYAALKSRLQLAVNSTAGKKSIFLDTIHHLGMVNQHMKNVHLSDLRLTGEKMEIQVSAPNLSVINEFHQQLQAAANLYTVKIGVNELTDDNVYKSILTVSAQ